MHKGISSGFTHTIKMKPIIIKELQCVGSVTKHLQAVIRWSHPWSAHEFSPQTSKWCCHASKAVGQVACVVYRTACDVRVWWYWTPVHAVNHHIRLIRLIQVSLQKGQFICTLNLHVQYYRYCCILWNSCWFFWHAAPSTLYTVFHNVSPDC